MSTYYEPETQRRAVTQAAAPKECPHCGAPINQGNGWDRVRYHCGSDRCRKAASRANIAARKRQERSAVRARILQYCNERLDCDQRQAVMNMTDMLMAFNYDEGHLIAQQVIQVLEGQRCKHDRIAQLEANAALWKRRAQASERQLKERIEELESELAVFNGLEATIHNIATEQQQKQPDPQEPQPRTPSQEPEPEEEDRARVLATLAEIGIQPYTGQSDDDTEHDEYEDGEDLD